MKESVSGIFIHQDEIFIIRRQNFLKAFPGYYSFPGGKVDEVDYENGEHLLFALERELKEELDIETRECCFSPIGFASHRYDDFHLLMPLFVCRVWQGEIKTVEHQAMEWVLPQDMYDYPMPEADIPLIYQLRDHL